jgi:acetyltransferase-like isoleucine patch superfamily enzyme
MSVAPNRLVGKVKVRALLRAAICFIFPSCEFKNILLRLLGWKIAKGVRIGASLILCENVALACGVRVGHLNYIDLDCLILRSAGYIQNLNRITGPFILALDEGAGIGNQNTIKRASKPITWGKSILRLGAFSKITAKHLVDCTRPVHIGSYSILAGKGTQLWTHGYLHALKGPGRFRTDGAIKIGSNVYVGSRCTLNMGIFIEDGVTVGSHSSVASSLKVSGLYVSQGLRFIPNTYEVSRSKNPRVQVDQLVEEVHLKRIT